MIKFTSNNDYDFQIESVSLVTDSKSLTKRASARNLLKYAKIKGQEDLHIIAVGAYEGTGFNRNGDGFMEKDCEANCHYFKDADRAVHRHHKNKPKDPKYGNIKAAAYNKPMKRVELVVGLDVDKCADILDEQEKTGNTNWSMASKQAYDICTWCDHKAKTDTDRCAHIPSKIGELNKEGVMCGMLNPDPRWFEISYVRRPADRIGVTLGKLASTGELKPMLPRDFLNIYGEIYVPDHIQLSKKACDKRGLLHKLAEIEKHVEGIARGGAKTSRDLYMSRHAGKLAKGGISDKTIDELRKYDPGQLLKLLADKGIIFNPEDFSKYLFGDRVNPENVQGMKSHLPDMHQQLSQEGGGDVLNNESFEPSMSGCPPQDAKQLVSGMAPDQSLNGDQAVKRIMRIIIMAGGAPGSDINAGGDKTALKPTMPEQKTKSAFDKELAKQYTAYKLAALNYLDEQNKLDDDIMWHAVLQNRI
jgi:hypothetical protein